MNDSQKQKLLYVEVAGVIRHDVKPNACCSSSAITRDSPRMKVLGESRVMAELEQHAFAADGTPLCIYGDSAYQLRIHIQTPFCTQPLTDEMRDYDRSTSAV